MKRILKFVAELLIAAAILAGLWCFACPRLFPGQMKANQAAYQEWLEKNPISK